MSTTATTACSMCHGSGYTVAGTPCSCGSLANRLTTSNKSDQAHLALLRAELAILRAELRAAEKDRDTWKLRARRMLREDSRFAVIREQESKLKEGWIISSENETYSYKEDIKNLTWQKPKTKREGWVNVYKCGGCDSVVYGCEATANNQASQNRIACIRIEWFE